MYTAAADGMAPELGTGTGTIGGRGLNHALIQALISTVPYATLSHECARVLGRPLEGCSCKGGIIKNVPPEIIIQAATPDVQAQVPATRVPTALVPAVRQQIDQGVVPSPRSPSIAIPAAKGRVIRALNLRQFPTAEDLNATIKGLGAIIGIANGRRGVGNPNDRFVGNPEDRSTITRYAPPPFDSRSFGAAGDDKEPPSEFEQAEEAKKGIATWWGTGVDPDKVPPAAAAKAAASGWPPPAAYRPGNWNFDESSYVLAFGDTLSGLAITYLGSPQRWKEIWNANPQDWRWNHNPDKLMAGEKIMMPIEARDMAIAMLSDKSSNPAPSTTGKKAPIDVPGENPNAPTVEGGVQAAAKSNATKLIIPVAIGATVLGVAWYALS